MASLDLSSILIGVLFAILSLLPLTWLFTRTSRQQGEDAGRSSREIEIAHLVAERQSLREDLVDARRSIEEHDALVQRLRETAERLGNERSALLVRAERLEALELSLTESRASAEQAARQVADLQARMEEQQRSAAERLRELENARERMKAEFQALASDILEDKAKKFTERSGEQLGLLLNPLREQIGDFRKLVSDSYDKEGKERAGLQAELRQLFELNKKLSQEADNLTRALTTDNRTQGYWGELKLENLLESAGLEKGRQYLTQESFTSEDGDRYRPDALLLLPEDKKIVIDAKVALLDYQRACGDLSDVEREQHLVRHVQALRNHIRLLGDKDYSRLPGPNSPDLVLMFVAVEPAFLEALRRDPGLYEFAYNRKIILVGPSNLLASLRLVAQLWRTDDQNRNARLIAERGAALYDKFVGFAEDLMRVGDALSRAQKAHDDAIGKLTRGRGNLLRQVQMLRELGVAPGKQLPSGLIATEDPVTGDAEHDDGNSDGADRSAPSD